MKVLRGMWMLVGLAVAIQYGYWGIKFAGAWLNLTDMPTVSNDWLALGMFGAMFTAVDFVIEDFKKIVS